MRQPRPHTRAALPRPAAAPDRPRARPLRRGRRGAAPSTGHRSPILRNCDAAMSYRARWRTSAGTSSASSRRTSSSQEGRSKRATGCEVAWRRPSTTSNSSLMRGLTRARAPAVAIRHVPVRRVRSRFRRGRPHGRWDGQELFGDPEDLVVGQRFGQSQAVQYLQVHGVALAHLVLERVACRLRKRRDQESIDGGHRRAGGHDLLDVGEHLGAQAVALQAAQKGDRAALVQRSRERAVPVRQELARGGLDGGVRHGGDLLRGGGRARRLEGDEERDRRPLRRRQRHGIVHQLSESRYRVALHEGELALVTVRWLAILVDRRVEAAARRRGAEIHPPRGPAARGLHLEQPVPAVSSCAKPRSRNGRKRWR
jgi:hypothetical protein